MSALPTLQVPAPHRAPPGVAAIYVRISEDREGADLGITRQEADCRPLCHRRGYPDAAIRVYADNDVSAYSGKVRPQYQRLLDDIAAGEVRFLVAWHADRLHRTPMELEHFIATVDAAGVDIETSRAGILDLSTPSGRMVARHLGTAARFESEHKAERQRRKHQELAEAGKVSGGGTRPYGYETDRRTVNAEEAVNVREAARRVLNGESIRSVCRDFTERGITTVQGGPWQPSVLRNLLLSARISGRREHGRRDPKTRSMVAAPIASVAEWEQIISPEDSDALRALLSDPQRRNHQPWNRRTYLLHGVARCALCRKPLVARPKDGGARCYVCASGPGFGGCGKIRCLADPLEMQVAADLVAAVDGGRLESILRDSDGGDATAAREETLAIEAERVQLGEDHASGAITRSEWMAMRTVLTSRLEAAQHRYDELRGSRSLHDLPRPLRPAWEAFDFGTRRSTIIDLIAEVRVGPDAVRGLNRFDPDRVSIVWKV